MALRPGIKDITAGYRAFRRATPTLRRCAMNDLDEQGNVARFPRPGDDPLFCAFNLGHSPSPVALPEGKWAQIGTDLGGQAPLSSLTLAPWAFVLAKRI